MKRSLPKLKWILPGLACVLLSACAGPTIGERIADMMPGWPRAQEAARPKAVQPDSGKSLQMRPVR
jgi:hypothetical protein